MAIPKDTWEKSEDFYKKKFIDMLVKKLDDLEIFLSKSYVIRGATKKKKITGKASFSNLSEEDYEALKKDSKELDKEEAKEFS